MKIKFLLPGTTRTWHSGGIFIALKLARYLSELCPLEIVTYKDHEPDHPFLTEEALASPDPSTLWLITFGPHISELLRRLAGHRVAYYAQSAGWSIDMLRGVPILCISRFVMAYWAQWAPYAPLFLLPPTLDSKCRNRRRRRDIDVLYLSRKTTPYVHDQLVPRLRERCRVETVDALLPHHEVLDLFNRSKLYIYDFAPTSERAWVDGFGLQPLEAIVCGCTVLAALSGGPCDFLDPGVNCTQISGSLERDVDAAVSAVVRHTGSNPDEEILREHYSEAALRERLAVLVKELESLDLRAEAGIRPPVIAPDHEVFSRQQQEIAVLKEQVRYHDNAVTIHRQGIDWLRGELSSRDTAIATLQEAIDWLKGEVAERERIMAAQQRPHAGSRPHDPANRTYTLYQRALNRYRRSGPVVRFVFERLIQAAVSPLSRWRGIRFPSRAIGGWWSIWRWRFEFLLNWNEYPSVAACRRLIAPGMTAIDVGAHIGYYTRLFSELVGPTGRVLAFEPEAENFALLRANVPAGKFGNVEMFDLVVADREGRATLHLSPGHTNHSIVAGYSESRESADVESVTLDAFLAKRGIDTVDFVKIDVEGGEPRVLAGMRGTLARCPNLMMLIEFNPTALQCGGVSPDFFLRSLSDLGFIVQASLPDGRWGDASATTTDTINLLCLPRQRDER